MHSGFPSPPKFFAILITIKAFLDITITKASTCCIPVHLDPYHIDNHSISIKENQKTVCQSDETLNFDPYQPFPPTGSKGCVGLSKQPIGLAPYWD